MKIFLTLAVVLITVLLTVSSCSDDNRCDSGFRVSPYDLVLSADGEEPQMIYVFSTSDVSWKATMEEAAKEWLTITAETDQVVVRASKNDTNTQRKGKVIITPDNGGIAPVEVTVTQSTVSITDVDITTAILKFYADYYECGLSNYYIIMGSGDAEYSDYDDNIYANNGYLIVLDVFTEKVVPEDYLHIELKNGVYKGSLDYYDPEFRFAPMSFFSTFITSYQAQVYYEGSMIIKYENNEIIDRFIISGGEMTVNNDGGNYTVSLVMTSPEGEKFMADYSGTFDAIVNSASVGTYTAPLNLTGLNTGTITFHGEDEWSPGCYEWTIIIDTPGYDNVTNLKLVLYSPTTSTTILEDGEYSISNVEPYIPYIAKQGFLFDDIYGCWVYEYSGDLINYAPLYEGTINVTYNSGDNYSIVIDAILDNLVTINASFKGDLEYSNNVSPAPKKEPAYNTFPNRAIAAIPGIKGKISENEPRNK